MQARKDATHSAQVDRVRYRPYTGLPTHTHTHTHTTTCRHARMQLTVPKWTGSGTGRTLGYLHTHTHHHMQARKDATHSAQVDRVRYRPYTTPMMNMFVMFQLLGVFEAITRSLERAIMAPSLKTAMMTIKMVGKYL